MDGVEKNRGRRRCFCQMVLLVSQYGLPKCIGGYQRCSPDPYVGYMCASDGKKCAKWRNLCAVRQVGVWSMRHLFHFGWNVLATEKNLHISRMRWHNWFASRSWIVSLAPRLGGSGKNLPLGRHSRRTGTRKYRSSGGHGVFSQPVSFAPQSFPISVSLSDSRIFKGGIVQTLAEIAICRRKFSGLIAHNCSGNYYGWKFALKSPKSHFSAVFFIIPFHHLLYLCLPRTPGNFSTFLALVIPEVFLRHRA